LALQVDIFRVCSMRSSLRKGRKVFECLVDMFGLDSRTWTTEDQLRISLSPRLVAELKASSLHPLSQAQPKVYPRHSATPIRDEHHHASRASRGSSASAEHVVRKRRHQDIHTKISSETYCSVNTDDNHHTCDTDDEDPRPAKRRKPHLAPTGTPPPHLRRSRPLESFSITSLEIDDAQPQANFGCPSTLVDDEHHHTPRTSRSPPASVKSAPIAEHQQWPFRGFLKYTRIGNETTYNLEFQLSHVPEHLHVPLLSEALGMHPKDIPDAPTEAATLHDASACSKVYPTAVRPRTKRVRWEPKEDAMVVKMREDGCSWETIQAALPRYRTQDAIQVRYSTKHKK
jgi:hypothetical protein